MERTTMNVRELASQMNISLPKAYKLVKTPGFPVIHIGSRILIPVEAYKDWLTKHPRSSENFTYSHILIQFQQKGGNMK